MKPTASPTYVYRGCLIWLVLMAIAQGHAASAATIRVPVGQPTIQAAINVAAQGDTVLVAAARAAGRERAQAQRFEPVSAGSVPQRWVCERQTRST